MPRPRDTKFDITPDLYAQGHSIAQIADMFGVTRQSMHKTMKRRGVEFRPQMRFGSDNNFYRGGPTADPKVHDIFEAALNSGEIERQDTCETCGAKHKYKNGISGVQAHHCDYNKPLEVMWLCQPCHFEWHQNNRAIPVTEIKENG